MLTTDQKNSILYQSQVWVSEEGYNLLEKEQYSEPCDEVYNTIFKILNYQLVLLDDRVDINLTVKEQEYIYRCIQDTIGLDNYPVASLPFAMVEAVNIIVGAPGAPGLPGAPGIDGTDATVNVITTDPELKVTVSTVLGVKTFDITKFTYVAGTITVNLNNALIPDPDQNHVVELGTIIPITQLLVNLTKNRDDIVASTLTNPIGLSGAYAIELDLVLLNLLGSQAIVVNIPDVAATQTYTVNIDDGTTVNQASDSLTFVYPFLYGNSSTTSISHYIDLNKLIQTKANKVIPFNGTVQYFWLGFPASYGTLVQILDQNGFDITGAFTELLGVTVNSSGLDANWSVSYNFYRTTLATTINGNYTFKFS